MKHLFTYLLLLISFSLCGQNVDSTSHNHRIILNVSSIFSIYTPGYEIYYQMPVNRNLVLQVGGKYVNSDIAVNYSSAPMQGFKGSLAMMYGGNPGGEVQFKYGPKLEYYYTEDQTSLYLGQGSSENFIPYTKYVNTLFGSFTMSLSYDAGDYLGINIFLDTGLLYKNVNDGLPAGFQDTETGEDTWPSFENELNKLRPEGNYFHPRMAGGIGVYWYF